MYYKIKDAAEKTGVHPSTIHSYVKRGALPYKMIGNAKAVQLTDVNKIKPLIQPRGQHARPNYGSHMVEINGKRLATVKKAARLLSIDRSTIYKYIRRGRIKEIRLPDYMFKFVDVDELKSVIDDDDAFKQKEIVFVPPKDDQRHARRGATTTQQRVEDLELLYYDMLEKVDGLQKAHKVLSDKLHGNAEAHGRRITALENQQPAQAEPAIDWSQVKRGTRVGTNLTKDAEGIFLKREKDIVYVIWDNDDTMEPNGYFYKNVYLIEEE